MKLTIRGRYAVMALLELAEYDGATPISLSLIAERQKLSLSYLELLFGKLRRRAWSKVCVGRVAAMCWQSPQTISPSAHYHGG